MAIREARQLAAEARIARAEEQRAGEEHPAPDPDMLAFTRRMTGAPEPPTVAEILARAQALPPEPVSMRGDVDPSAEYGSQARPGLLIDGKVIGPRVQRSAGWPSSEAELDRMLARSREAGLWMAEYLSRTDPDAAMAAARARAARGQDASRGYGDYSRGEITRDTSQYEGW